jgi:DsbC/DsbD-like thiol-disulfide interchange protein
MNRTFLTLCCLALATTAPAQPAPVSRRATGPYTAIELIAAEAAATPGADLWIAVRFQLEPGWHIYWQNPGDSGTAPIFTWQLPAGVHAGDIEWPAPERIPAGTLVNYGYEDGVVLPLPLRVQASATAQPLVVGLQAKWLVCKEMCVGGQGRIELRLPLGAADRAAVPDWKRQIELARARVPKPAPAAWKASVVSQKDAFVLTIDAGARQTAGVFFPLEVSQINDSAPQQARAIDRGLELTLQKSDQLSRDPQVLKGVIVLPGQPAFAIQAPVRK